ncbi:tail fiber assembly protein [Morganella morganii]|uniref:tail fiber assembly protein n=1 Tax=Morganella morganii TaxID=582 RepID=UPI0021CFA100|nr:tail fiber assembly protein [Morganella morganii]MCU6211815.1 tail fiber assembly protein [Morganella morganii]
MSTEILEQKFFKDLDNNVFCIEIMPINQNSWESEIQAGWIAISENEANQIANPPPTKEQLILQAEEKKQFLIAEVHTETEMPRAKLALGRISEGEKIRLNAWLDYLDELEAVDVLFIAPDIIWPVKPVV